MKLSISNIPCPSLRNMISLSQPRPYFAFPGVFYTAGTTAIIKQSCPTSEFTSRPPTYHSSSIFCVISVPFNPETHIFPKYLRQHKRFASNSAVNNPKSVCISVFFAPVRFPLFIFKRMYLVWVHNQNLWHVRAGSNLWLLHFSIVFSSELLLTQIFSLHATYRFFFFFLFKCSATEIMCMG